MQENVPYGVEKWSDITHAKRSLTTRLYNISQHNKFTDCSPLTQKVINYLAKCFSYCVAQNKGNPVELKKSLSQIIPHSFRDHSCCNSSWCRFNDNPTTYTHKDLPYGNDLYGDKLKKLLTELFNEYCTDTVVSKLAPCANSQRNESLNSVIGTKNPKTRYYGGSESSDFRVACGIAQVNIGYGYISNTLERLNIEPGAFCAEYVTKMDRKSHTAKLRKDKKEAKYRRNQLRRQKNSKIAKSEKKEGKTYESNIGLNLQLPSDTSLDPLQITESITDDQHQRYEKLVPEFCQQPANQAICHDATINYRFFVFDTETTTMGRQAEICQLSAVDDDGQNEFSCYVMPERNISKHASDVL